MIEKIKSFFVGEKANTALINYSALCTGEIELYDLFSVNLEKQELLKIAAAAFRGVESVFSGALGRAAVDMDLYHCEREYAANGCVKALVCGKRYFLGNKHFLKKNGIAFPDSVAKLDFSGYTVLYAASKDAFCGMLIFRDRLIPSARGAVRQLRSLGLKTVITCAASKENTVKDRLGIDEIRAAILKIEREKVLQELKKGDKILVIDKACDIEKVLGIAAASKTMEKVKRLNLVPSFVGSIFSLMCLSMPWLSVLMLANTSAFVLYNSLSLRRYAPYVADMTEEESMFGKVNYTIKVGGMSCAHCSARVKSALESIRGVSASVSLDDKSAHVKCPASLDTAKLSYAITEAGFTVVSVEKV